jgi:hypothetical protein
VASFPVTAATATQQTDFQMVCDEALRKAMIAARKEFLTR